MIDLLTADIKLPDCQGTELAEEADHLGIPSILMTGDFDVYTKLTGAGQECLLKPFSIATFIKAVE
jgi:DNA-binding response OmpR family regulator